MSSPSIALRKQARRAATPRDKRARTLLIAQHEGRCYLCGGTIDMRLEFPDPMSGSVEHILPIARGGSDTAANLALSHLGENMSRGSQTVAEWRARRRIPARLPGDIDAPDWEESAQVIELRRNLSAVQDELHRAQLRETIAREAIEAARSITLAVEAHNDTLAWINRMYVRMLTATPGLAHFAGL